MAIDYGKPCTETESCTYHNLHCSFPDCAKGRAEKKAKAEARKDEPREPTVAELKARIAYLEERLECNRMYQMIDGVMTRIEMRVDEAYDGISCRDETIRLQDQLIDELRADKLALLKTAEQIGANAQKLAKTIEMIQHFLPGIVAGVRALLLDSLRFCATDICKDRIYRGYRDQDNEWAEQRKASFLELIERLQKLKRVPTPKPPRAERLRALWGDLVEGPTTQEIKEELAELLGGNPVDSHDAGTLREFPWDNGVGYIPNWLGSLRQAVVMIQKREEHRGNPFLSYSLLTDINYDNNLASAKIIAPNGWTVAGAVKMRDPPEDDRDFARALIRGYIYQMMNDPE